MKIIWAFCTLLLFSQNFGFERPKIQHGEDLKPNLLELDPNHLPQNTAAQVVSRVVLTCGVTNSEIPHSVQWIEYAYNSNGNLISDNGVILGHPQAARYRIISNQNGYYDLQISNLSLADGGVYMCQDTQTNPALKRQHSAALTVIDIGFNDENCNSTIPPGLMLEGSYQTSQCSYNYKGPIVPNMTWTGMQPFQQNYIASENNIWNKMDFNATREMDTRAYFCTLDFSNYFLPVDVNFASNVPDFEHTYQTYQMFVNWGPQKIEVFPIKPLYEIGDYLQCIADAFPPAYYTFENLRTGEKYENTQIIQINESWRGFSQSVKCEAINIINGVVYTDSIVIIVDVAATST